MSKQIITLSVTDEQKEAIRVFINMNNWEIPIEENTLVSDDGN